MSDWYASSVAWAAIPQWAASTAYSVGQIIRPLAAPAAGREYAFRCTTAGTSGTTEPGWNTGNNSTTLSGSATFTNVTGQSAYGWSAAAGTLYVFTANTGTRAVAGDRVFVSSDSVDSFSANLNYGFGNSGFGLVQVLSVNRAGSVPPVAADSQAGATITLTLTGTNSLVLDTIVNTYWEGFSFTVSGSPTTTNIYLANIGSKSAYFKNCTFNLNGTTTSRLMTTSSAKVTFDNTTVQFNSTSASFIGCASTLFDLTWVNTPSAVGGSTPPTTLFTLNTGVNTITCRGVDLSAVTGTLVAANPAVSPVSKVLFDSCKIAAAVTRYGTPAAATCAADEVELVNCWDGSNVLNERYTPAGAVTTDRSATLANGAVDDIGNYSLKLVSSVRSDFASMPLPCFTLDVENTAVGASKTATVELISSGSLNNTDIRLSLEYMGSSGNPMANFVDSLSSILAAASALPASSNTWNNPPATPQKQLLQVAFTPQRAGRVRGLIRLGKASTTVWVNPQLSIV